MEVKNQLPCKSALSGALAVAEHNATAIALAAAEAAATAVAKEAVRAASARGISPGDGSSGGSTARASVTARAERTPLVQEEGMMLALASQQHYQAPGSLRQALASGDTVLIRADWVEEVYLAGGILPRRQDLPDHAKWNPNDVAFAEDDPTAPRVAILAISYSWLSPNHPDPKGFHLRSFGPLLRPFARRCRIGLENVAIFLDWCSLPQHPRSKADRAAYARALRHIHLWYAHRLTHVWLLTSVPRGLAPYGERGWTSFERAICTLVGPPEAALDLGWLGSGTATAPAGWVCWAQVVRDCQVHRQPPATPEAFAADLACKMFSVAEDRQLLAARYQRVFDEQLGCADVLQYGCMDWGDREVQELAHALPLLQHLHELELQENDISSDGAAILSRVLPQCKLLTRLNLTGNHLAESSRLALLEAWLNAGKPKEGLELEDVRTEGPKSCMDSDEQAFQSDDLTLSERTTEETPSPVLPRARTSELFGSENLQLAALLERQEALEAKLDGTLNALMTKVDLAVSGLAEHVANQAADDARVSAVTSKPFSGSCHRGTIPCMALLCLSFCQR